MMNQQSVPPPCLFVFEPDHDVQSGLKANLQGWGYDVIMAIDEADAMQRTQGGHQRFDLILLNQYNQSIEAVLAIGQKLRQSSELTSLTPIIILAEHYDEELEGQDISIGDNEYICYLEDAEQLRAILQRLCPIG